MSLVLVTPPAAEPLELSVLKAHLRVTHTSEDGLIQFYLEAARAALEERLDRQLITATYDEWFDSWPRGRQLELARAPLQSVTAVTYYDEEDTEATLSSSLYFVDTAAAPGRVALKTTASWPTTLLRPVNSVKARLIAGYGTAPASVPAPIREAILLLAAHSYVHREPVLVGTIQSVLPFGVWDQLVSYQVRAGLA